MRDRQNSGFIVSVLSPDFSERLWFHLTDIEIELLCIFEDPVLAADDLRDGGEAVFQRAIFVIRQRLVVVIHDSPEEHVSLSEQPPSAEEIDPPSSPEGVNAPPPEEPNPPENETIAASEISQKMHIDFDRNIMLSEGFVSQIFSMSFPKTLRQQHTIGISQQSNYLQVSLILKLPEEDERVIDSLRLSREELHTFSQVRLTL